MHDSYFGEAAAILIHLCETRDLPYIPKTPKERGLMNHWMHWHHTGTRMLNKFLHSLWAQESVEKAMGLLIKSISALKYLEDSLGSQGTKYLAGDEVSIADIFILTEIDVYDSILDDLFADKVFPKVEAWRTSMTSLPEYAANFEPTIAVMGYLTPLLGPIKAKIEGSKLQNFIVSSHASSVDESVKSEADADGDGNVSFAEYKAYMQKLMAE